MNSSSEAGAALSSTGGRITANKNLIALALLLVAIAIVYFQTYQSIVQIWLRSDTFLHGLIIVPLSAFLIWRKRAVLRSIGPQANIIGIALLLGISIGWLMADLLGIQVGKQFAAVAMIPTAIFVLMGGNFVRKIAFPLAYLIFAVPFGEFWVPELMEITADFAVGLSQLTGIPVLRDGLYLSIPAGNFEVAKACSGIRYLLATLALGTLYAYLNYTKAYKKWIFIGFSFVLPIVANGFRAYGIIAIAHYSDMKYAVGVDHIIYGWIFFGFVIVLMFLVGSRYSDADAAIHEHVVDTNEHVASTDSDWKLASVVVGTMVAIMVGPLTSYALVSTKSPSAMVTVGLPSSVSEWQGNVLSDSDWNPSFVGATQELLVRYSASESQIDIALIVYFDQRQGSELASSSNSILGVDGWQQRSARKTTVELSDGQIHELIHTVAVRRGAVRHFWNWYEVDGKPVTSGTEIKLNEAFSLLTGKPGVSAAVILSVSDNNSDPSALSEFLNDAYGAIRSCALGTAPRESCDLRVPYSEQD